MNPLAVTGPAMSEQYPRLQRFYKRIADGNRRTTRYLDDLWSFFQHCWHFKDWIKNDKTIPITVRKRVEKDIRKCRYLRICGDLANRSKHLRLTKRRNGKEVPRKGAKMVRRILVGIAEVYPTGDSEGSVAYDDTVIRVTGSEIGAVELARKAIGQWDRLLKQWKLVKKCAT
jgi:hypothetical protein